MWSLIIAGICSFHVKVSYLCNTYHPNISGLVRTASLQEKVSHIQLIKISLISKIDRSHVLSLCNPHSKAGCTQHSCVCLLGSDKSSSSSSRPRGADHPHAGWHGDQVDPRLVSVQSLCIKYNFQVTGRNILHIHQIYFVIHFKIQLVTNQVLSETNNTGLKQKHKISGVCLFNSHYQNQKRKNKTNVGTGMLRE